MSGEGKAGNRRIGVMWRSFAPPAFAQELLARSQNPATRFTVSVGVYRI